MIVETFDYCISSDSEQMVVLFMIIIEFCFFHRYWRTVPPGTPAFPVRKPLNQKETESSAPSPPTNSPEDSATPSLPKGMTSTSPEDDSATPSPPQGETANPEDDSATPSPPQGETATPEDETTPSPPNHSLQDNLQDEFMPMAQD